ncbi:MAG: lipoate--protein ligase family protein [Anaerolineae bacterium]|nr:lipoate--protein ligase family protein [Anaerolineae bacterium]
MNNTISSHSPYPPASWRLLITPPLDGATNMAIDEAILHAVAEGSSIPTLRFFQWQPPTLTLGYNQHWTDIDLDAVERLNYTWTRRATGGRAILHIDEVTYSLIIPQSNPRIEGGIMESYRVLSLGLIEGLKKLGVDAMQADREGTLARRKAARKLGPVCFDTPNRYEIIWQDKKLIGSAQLRRKQTVLQHGTLPLFGQIDRIIDVLAFDDEERRQQRLLLPDRATTLETVLGRVLDYDAVVAALADGFAQTLNLTFTTAPLTDREQELTEQLRATQYANDDWIKRV